MKAKITTIQRMSLHDGPGIRSTLFLKGCNFRCPWCHNPETLSPKIQLQYISSKCIACGTCVTACQRGALSLKDGVLRISRSLCDVCGKCSQACLSGALNLVGREVSVDEALELFLKDKVFYETSGGTSQKMLRGRDSYSDRDQSFSTLDSNGAGSALCKSLDV